LFVEDLEEDMDLLLRELRRGGFEPEAERVQTEGELRGALSRPWDVAVCDWVLPGFSAPEAIAVLVEAAFDGAIIVVSGSMGEEHVVEAMRAGAHDYVIKENLHRLVPAIVRELREADDRRAVRRADEELRRHSLIFENLNDAVVVVDQEGLILDLNPAAESMTGVSKAEAVGRLVSYLRDPEQEQHLSKEIAHAVETEGRWTGVVPSQGLDGAERFLDLVVVPLWNGRGERLGSVGVSRDITERIRSEERLRETIDELRRTDHQRRQLLSRLVSAQEEERQRIAGEIHDDPVQQLYAATLRLGMLRDRIAEAADRESVESIGDIVDGTITRLRHMLFELQPRSLESDGLGAALAEYAAYANQESETVFQLDDRLTAPLTTEIRAVAYRLILEATSNVRKHAGARRATITIADQDDGLLCTITDDGRGFLTTDHVERYRPGHLGIPAMVERAELAGGHLQVASAPGEGTTVEFWLPGT
jgi:two-component system sensor histidine kinase UhpB